MELKDWAQLQEAMLKSQLKVIRQFLRGTEPAGGRQLRTDLPSSCWDCRSFGLPLL